METVIKDCVAALRKVVVSESITVFFQPLVSLESKAVVGFESFTRGVDDNGKTVASPQCLFNEKLPLKIQDKVESLCIKSSLDSFVDINEKYNDMLLFMNVNSVLPTSKEFADHSPQQLVVQYEINPRVIVFEFEVSQLKKNVPLKLIRDLQAGAFRISLDSIDDSIKSKELLFRIRPDFAKLDRQFYLGIEKDKYRKRVVETLCLSMKRVGVMVAAKGVETEQEALALADAGVTLQQGYFYSDTGGDSAEKDSFAEKVARLNKFLRKKQLQRNQLSEACFGSFHLLLKSCISKLVQEGRGGTEKVLEELVKNNPTIVSAFTINASGKQESRRYVGRAGDAFGRRVLPSLPGTDHSHQEYFMYLNSGLERIAGKSSGSPFCREEHRYLAGFYYNEERKGGILVIEYVEREQDRES